jgi:protein-tyrosine phosphatase
MMTVGRLTIVAGAALLLACGTAGDTEGGCLLDGATPGVWLDLDGVTNARDLGGFAAAGGKTVRWRMLMHGGDLSGLSTAGCETWAALGVHTLADLRDASEAAAAPDADCATPGYQNVPLEKLLPPGPDTYVQLLRDSGAAFAEMFVLLAAPDALPWYHHCVIGRDRASVVSALILLALGVSEEDVVTEFMRSNDVGTAVEAAWIQAVIDEVSGQGGIEPYLATRGVTTAQLDALRAAALE